MRSAAPFTALHLPFAIDENPAQSLHTRFSERLQRNPELSRTLVSFQANKEVPFYRWFRYREAFSRDFAESILKQFSPTEPGPPPRVLDPFAGAGTTLVTATSLGWDAIGIELLPVGSEVIRARFLADKVSIPRFEAELPDVNGELSLGVTRAPLARNVTLPVILAAF